MRALAVTATAVFALLAALIVWFAFAPGNDPDGPVVTIAVSPPPAPPRPAAPAAAPLDLPPGFGITGPPGSPPSLSPGPMQPPAQLQSAPPPAPALQKDAAAGSTELDEAKITLVAAPVPELIEESRYGPLPKVAADGRKPLDVYGRPFSVAAKAAGVPPRVALLVSGMARADPATTKLVMKLPPRVSLAYAAYGQDLQTGVNEARREGHEVLLEVPLEPADYPQNDPGPHTLLTNLPPAENMKRLQWLMSRFTGYVGTTNAMGAKFLGHRDSLLPILEEVKSRGLLFLEDGGAEGSVARDIAGALGLSYSVANIRIDTLPGADDISKALSRLEDVARERGTAIGIASARPETIKQVAAWAGQLDGKGVVLIPVSAAVRSLQQS